MSSLIQWYPGHIAKARKGLQEQLKNVDLVFEVLDARIPRASRHQEIHQLIGARKSVLVLNKMDTIPQSILRQWQRAFEAEGSQVCVTDAQKGKGMRDLLNAAQKAAQAVNERRLKRGMNPRPLRAAVIGFPNVGKSALINRLVGKRAVASASKPGVTRQLRWVRILDHLELLDSPGILPPRIEDQEAAVKLAICDDIGQAAYQEEQVAIEAIKIFQTIVPGRLAERYALSFTDTTDTETTLTAEAWLDQLAKRRFGGSGEKTARAILQDFRKGLLGAIALEVPLDIGKSPQAGAIEN
ncbi:MAG: ribosome biogenesis GTPase YlqF [Gloeobacterales cyanobacterium]